jgi:hypothetical protein
MTITKAEKPEAKPARAAPASLAPLSTEDALRALLQTPPAAIREPATSKPKTKRKTNGSA